MSAGCGACNACCKLLDIPALSKPAGMQCWNTGVHGGCARHAEKATAPELEVCAQWKCVWLESQDLEDASKRMPRGLRPDICHVMLGPQHPTIPGLIFAHVDPRKPDAWTWPGINDTLMGIVERGGEVEVVVGDLARISLNKETVHPVVESDPS